MQRRNDVGMAEASKQAQGARGASCSLVYAEFLNAGKKTFCKMSEGNFPSVFLFGILVKEHLVSNKTKERNHRTDCTIKLFRASTQYLIVCVHHGLFIPYRSVFVLFVFFCMFFVCVLFLFLFCLFVFFFVSFLAKNMTETDQTGTTAFRLWLNTQVCSLNALLSFVQASCSRTLRGSKSFLSTMQLH